MRRFRLSTLMLLIVIAALAIALVVEEQRAARREAELQAEMAALQSRLAQSWPVVLPPRKQKAMPRMRTDDENDLIKRLNRQLKRSVK
jgi:hypothetical protein